MDKNNFKINWKKIKNHVEFFFSLNHLAYFLYTSLNTLFINNKTIIKIGCIIFASNFLDFIFLPFPL